METVKPPTLAEAARALVEAMESILAHETIANPHRISGAANALTAMAVALVIEDSVERAARSLLGAIEEMKVPEPQRRYITADTDPEDWYGGFSEWTWDDQMVSGYIEWPNLNITARELREALGD